MITVISVMNGFESELKTRMLSMISHITVQSAGGLDNWQDLDSRMTEHPEVLAAAPYVESQTLLQGRRTRGAIVRGMIPDKEANVSNLEQKMLYGHVNELKDGEFGIVLGVELAWSLGVTEGDDVTVFAPQIRTGPTGLLPQVRRFKVLGVFEAGMNQYDGNLAVMHLEDAKKLFRMGDKVSGLRLKVNDMDKAYTVARDLQNQVPENVRILDWGRQHINWFRAIATEKTAMFIILSLIVAVAAFNIVSTLVMAVTDKQADIAILRTLGMSPGEIMRLFMVQGMVIGVVGIITGVGAGVFLSANIENIVPFIERLLGIDLLADDLYYINDLKGEIRWPDVIKIAVISFLATLFSTIYPSWRAARVSPAEALRYE